MKAYNLNVNLTQNQEGYRYSLEPFLLADFINDVFKEKDIKKIIELGTGSGITAILLSEYFHKSKIWGIEIQPGLVKTAKKNVAQNNAGNRVKIIEADIKKIPLLLPKASFDLVVTNPPYRKTGSGRINPNSEKAIARHELKINLNDLLESSEKLLKVHGSLIIIYHPNRLDELFYKMISVNIKPRYIKFVHHTSDSNSNIVLVEGVKKGKSYLKCFPPIILEK